MKMKNLLLIGLLPLFIISCAKEDSENVNQDSIHQQYEVLYADNEDKTHVSAIYRFGGVTGTLLQLSSPAGVTFNGDELMYNQVLGWHRKEYAGLVSSGTFVYTDLDDNVYTNTTPEINTIGYPTGLTEISMGGAFTFTWTGDPVGENETVSLWIDGTQQGNSELFTTILEGNSELVLPANRLANLGLGQATCWLVRTKRVDLQNETSKGGFIEVKYRAVSTLNIVE
jgi:hypothetical protein